MIRKFIFGKRTGTFSVTEKVQEESEEFPFGTFKSKWPFDWSMELADDDIVFGLGESMRGINKRGFLYKSFCTDCPGQTESTASMYGAHNFIIVFGKKTFALFFDTASEITFDIDYTEYGILNVKTKDTGLDLYLIESDGKSAASGESELNDISLQFRKLIGQSYIPPKWAFGYQQSRWGYKTEEDVRAVVANFKKENLPISAICLDIDYMEEYEDFTVDKNKFPNLKKLSDDMKKEGIHLVPIIDAGVKIKEGYSVYEEGVKNDFFCKRADGSFYTAGVWPGRSHFTDFFKKDARSWFGKKYKVLTDLGIDGFWNDMNEPAMFYSDESLKAVFEKIKSYEGKNLDINSFFSFSDLSGSTFNRQDDYERFYHTMPHKKADESVENAKKIQHSKIHNLYGAWMTRAAGEGLKRISPEKRMLIYSRASTIGAHRYGGIWQGDNASTWAHLLMEIKMLPSLNMCGFLYNGADIGGFGDSTTRDLLMRWLSLGVFTPLMRNHSAWNTREQECYAFKDPQDFKSILDLRYALLPYIYSEFVKCACNAELYIRPLSFDFAEDKRVLSIEDQLMVGEGIMIAPVYTQNAAGRYVYLPEPMTLVRWENSKQTTKMLKKGDHFIEVPEESVVFFVRNKKLVPLAKPALCSKDVSFENFSFVGNGKTYELYKDDGYTRNINLEKGIKILKR